MKDIIEQLIALVREKWGWRPVVEILGFALLVIASLNIASQTPTNEQLLAVLICLTVGFAYISLAYRSRLPKWALRTNLTFTMILGVGAALTSFQLIHGTRSRIKRLQGESKILEDHGMYTDAISKITEAVNTAHDAGDKESEAKSLCERGLYQLLAGQVDSSANSYQACASLSALIGNGVFEGDARVGLGQTQEAKGHRDLARQEYTDALDAYQQSKSASSDRDAGEADAHIGLGILATEESLFAKGREEFAKAAPLYERSGNKRRKGNVFEYLGRLEVAAGNAEAARNDYGQALSLFKTEKDRMSEANVLQDLAALESSVSNEAAAREDLRNASGLFGELNSISGQASTIAAFGDLDFKDNQIEAALDEYTKALELYRQAGHRSSEAAMRKMLGLCEGRLSHYDKAEEHLLLSRSTFHELGDVGNEAIVISAFGDAERGQNRPERASEQYREALSLFRKQGDKPGQANTLYSLGYVEGMASHWDNSKQCFERSATLFHELGNGEGEAQSYYWWAVAVLGTGDKLGAKSKFELAEKLAMDAGDQTLAKNAKQQTILASR